MCQSFIVVIIDMERRCLRGTTDYSVFLCSYRYVWRARPCWRRRVVEGRRLNVGSPSGLRPAYPSSLIIARTSWNIPIKRKKQGSNMFSYCCENSVLVTFKKLCCWWWRPRFLNSQLKKHLLVVPLFFFNMAPSHTGLMQSERAVSFNYFHFQQCYRTTA